MAVQKHPCRECRRMPGGQNIGIEPCRSCDQPGIYINSIGAAGIGTMPVDVSDWRPKPKRENVVDIVETNDSGTETCVCKECGVSKLYDKDHFKNSRFGLTQLCNECYGRRLRMAHTAKKKLQGSRPTLDDPKTKPKTVSPSPPPYKRNAEPCQEIYLDLSQHPDLLDSIRKEATEQFRSVDSQILYLLHLHLKKGILLAGKDFTR